MTLTVSGKTVFKEVVTLKWRELTMRRHWEKVAIGKLRTET
jgi:hypothetical protein